MSKKFFAFLLLVFICGPALAGCGGGLTGSSVSSDFYIGEGDCEFDEEMIVVSQGERKKQYKFNKECKYFGESNAVTGFSCPNRGKSPLAGTKYRLRVNHEEKGVCGETPRRYYVCAAGCSDAVPSAFDIEPEECDG